MELIEGEEVTVVEILSDEMVLENSEGVRWSVKALSIFGLQAGLVIETL